MTGQQAEYIATFGFDPRTVLLIVGCIVLMVASIQLPTDPASASYRWRHHPPVVLWALKATGITLFGVGGAWLALSAALGGKALCVDRHGITLGSARVRSSTRTIHVDWDDVAEIVRYDQVLTIRGTIHRLPLIGLQLRADAPATPTTRFDPEGWWWRSSYDLIPHVPADVVDHSSPIIGWRLDERRLCAAVARHAPGVPVIRIDDHGHRRPLCGP